MPRVPLADRAANAPKASRGQSGKSSPKPLADRAPRAHEASDNLRQKTDNRLGGARLALLFLSCDALGVAPYAKSWGAPYVWSLSSPQKYTQASKLGDKGLTSPTPTGPSLPRHGSTLASRYPALP